MWYIILKINKTCTVSHKKFYKSRQHILLVSVISEHLPALNTWYYKTQNKMHIYRIFEILQIMQVMSVLCSTWNVGNLIFHLSFYHLVNVNIENHNVTRVLHCQMYFVGSHECFSKQQRICCASLLIWFDAYFLRFAFVGEVLSAQFAFCILVYTILVVLLKNQFTIAFVFLCGVVRVFGSCVLPLLSITLLKWYIPKYLM